MGLLPPKPENFHITPDTLIERVKKRVKKKAKKRAAKRKAAKRRR